MSTAPFAKRTDRLPAVIPAMKSCPAILLVVRFRPVIVERDGIKFQSVADQLVSEALRYRRLQCLNFAILEFNHVTTFDVDQMVVMILVRFFIARPAIAKIVAVMMGLGLLLHLGSLWTSGFLSYLGIALVGAGLLLSFLPTEYTASPSKKSA